MYLIYFINCSRNKGVYYSPNSFNPSIFAWIFLLMLVYPVMFFQLSHSNASFISCMLVGLLNHQD